VASGGVKDVQLKEVPTWHMSDGVDYRMSYQLSYPHSRFSLGNGLGSSLTGWYARKLLVDGCDRRDIVDLQVIEWLLSVS
jgi:hypothetical protein